MTRARMPTAPLALAALATRCAALLPCGRPKVRTVNPNSEAYRVAREYQIRLEPEDFADEDRLRALAAAANMTSDAFTERYGYLCAQDAFCPRH